MSERFDRILRAPCLLSRFDDSDCSGTVANLQETSHHHSNVVHVTEPRENGALLHRDSPGAVSSVQSTMNDWNYAQLFIAELVHILCQASEPRDRNGQTKLFQKIVKTLVQNGITSPVCYSHQLHGLREHVRQAFIHLFSNAQKAVHSEEELGRHSAANSHAVVAFDEPLLLPATSPYSAVPRTHWQGRAAASANAIGGRYLQDFEELDQLGKGGFGAVFKARNFVDSQLYAIKKALREVKSLAALTHPNIVRYFASWLEFDTPIRSCNEQSRSRRVQVQEISWESVTDCRLVPMRLRHCLSSPDISSGSALNSAWDDIGYHSSLPIVDGDKEDGTGRLLQEGTIHMSGTLVLYLQMELCSSTLRTWLNQRNNSALSRKNVVGFDRFSTIDKSKNKRILRQMLEALSYIHSQGIIHRDLKPGNVFLRSEPGDSSSLRVLLGDFGLSCREIPHPARHADSLPSDQHIGSGAVTDRTTYRHSSGMGTFAYSAPEQLRSQFYDCKVDMFSFGIIAMEMYFPFFSVMERMHNIMRIRSGDLDEEFQRRFPLQAAIIRQLAQKKAGLRPTARELLEGESAFMDDFMTVSDLKKKLKEVEEELSKLRNENTAKV